MSRSNSNTVLALAVIAAGLSAGLYYTFSVAILPGLQNADDRTLIDAMQHINTAIENPAFFATFLGGPALALAALVMARGDGSPELVRWIAWGLGLSVLGIIVTGAFSIPLNDDLDAVGNAFQLPDPAKARDDYVDPWVAWNIVRALIYTGSFACLLRAVFINRLPARELRG
jgi:uncharacterized membrane protein